MGLPFEMLLALRYVRARRRGRRRDGFLSFISGMSVASTALGVMALIIVLSVMNGFQKEVRDRMLSVLPHVEAVSMSGPMRNWKEIAAAVEKDPEVVAAAPFTGGQALLSAGSSLRGAALQGIDPELEPRVSTAASEGASREAVRRLTPGSFGIVLGSDLARLLGVRPGDAVTVAVPRGNMTPAGFVPRMKQVTVAGILRSGHYEYDSTMAWMHVEDAAKLLRTGGPTGLRIRIADMQQAPAASLRIASLLPPGVYVTDWTKQNRTWFAAVQVEKRMMSVILFLIVLVGAFGLVSTLVMTVKEKQSDIAILRTLGASRSSILSVFLVQGAVVGFAGVAAGTGLGLLIACNLDVIVPAIEGFLGVQFLPKEIYFISQMPSDPRASDIIPIAAASFVMSLLATLYPAWRAARTQPAEALRHE